MTIPSWARVGAKVQCINGTGGLPGYGIEERPKSGNVYTIRATGYHLRTGEPTMLLDEIINPVLDYYEGRAEVAFVISRFRPLTTTKTQAEDVAMIRSLIKDEVNA